MGEKAKRGSATWGGGSRRTRNPLRGPDHILVSATTTMAPSRPSRDIKLTVPRFNSKKVRPKLVKEIVSIAKREKVKVDVKQTVDPTTALALAIVSSPYNLPPVYRPNA